LREVADERPALLAAHAGLTLGAAEAADDTLAPQYRAEAAKQVPYTGDLERQQRAARACG